MRDHRMHHFAGIVIPKSNVSIFVGRYRQRQRRMTDDFVNVFGGGVDTFGRHCRMQSNDGLGRFDIEDDAMRARV